MKIAQVVIPRYLDRVFDYIVDPTVILTPGSWVRVGFGKGKDVAALVWVLKATSQVPLEKLKTIKKTLDIPPTSPFLQDLILWVSSYYGAPLGMILKNVIPRPVLDGVKIQKTRKAMLEVMASQESKSELQLTLEQQNAFNTLVNEKKKRIKKPVLLRGVTGSGKTEVYMRIIKECCDKGESSIVLVPEISLTPQLQDIFFSRFGSSVAIFHSGLSDGERSYYWNQVAHGHARIVIGARSAIFAPVKKLGCLIVDEEHERTYKQEESPRYHARDLAVVRGQIEGALVILGSATPSMESFHNAKNEKYLLIDMPNRVSSRPLPKLEYINLQLENQRNKSNYIFSSKLLDEVSKRLEENEQSILLVNRRGFSNIGICSKCRHILSCKNCSLALTYHQTDSSFKCHRCQFILSESSICPSCDNQKWKKLGVGSQKVEQQLKKIFPEANIARVDTDTVKKKGYFSEVWKGFKSQKIDILVGTQMIAKGLDIENVTLVGVIAADLGVNIPDFRAGESVFSLICQVAGRAGRGKKSGQVLVQTANETHPLFKLIKSYDHNGFYEYEIKFRKELGYPPVKRFILLTISSRNEDRLAKFSHSFTKNIRQIISNSNEEVIGPYRAPIHKINTLFRYQVLIHTLKVKSVVSKLRKLTHNLDLNWQKSIQVDVDPYSLL